MQERNWKQVTENLLWQNFVRSKHEPSGWCLIDSEDEYTIARGYHKGDIIFGLSCSSIIHPTYYHELTWKDLMWHWGIHRDRIVSDTHDCSICPKNQECKAYFKGDIDHEQCSWWIHNVSARTEFKEDYAKN